uniref:Replication-associated protein n=1 Tax=Tarsiger cyanurus CRESS-DNA-virus sp. TaxID=2815060 RepID=A0A8A4XB54_9VIRU|nr:MAG: replication-associated protein [Tarsiger cyanurus CRESS-DNA-virus sp.]
MPRQVQSIQYKNWCFTLNNYTEDSYANVQAYAERYASYAVIGKERGESGTPHLQGYLQLEARCRFETIKARTDPGIHLEPARGTPLSNRTYCIKDGDFWEHGQLAHERGSKSSREEIVVDFRARMVRGRQGMVEFADSFPATYFFSGHALLRNYAHLVSPAERPAISVDWFFGPPGSGKSRRAHAELPGAFVKEPRTKWWNGYYFEREVIIDDFGPSGIDINHLLRWFDRYKCYVESKGGMLALLAERFIVTSNFHPDQVFSFGGELNPQLPALMRRINLIEFH